MAVPRLRLNTRQQDRLRALRAARAATVRPLVETDPTAWKHRSCRSSSILADDLTPCRTSPTGDRLIRDAPRVRGRGYRAGMHHRVGVWCEECGISLSRHGSECGTEAGDPYSDPDYGRPGGWATPDDEMIIPANIANLDY